MLLDNAANVGLIAGLMFQAGKAISLGLLLPHGLLERRPSFCRDWDAASGR